METKTPFGLVLFECKGIKEMQCPSLALAVPSPGKNLTQAVIQTGWPDFLRKEKPTRVKAHESLRIAVAGCANGCSRPHIADIGIILSAVPSPGPEQCTQCGTCVDTCPDRAVRISDQVVWIDTASCLSCGKCIQACPAAALQAGDSGFRILIGGKLGRHPRLARRLPGLYREDDLLRILSQCLSIVMENYRHDKRISDLLYENTVRNGD